MRTHAAIRRPALRRVLLGVAALPFVALVPSLVQAQGATHVDGAVAPVARLAAAPQHAVAPAPAAAPRAARIVGEYAIVNARRGFPVAFTVADSAGQLVASYRVAGDAAPRPMQVEVREADLVLVAETADGPLTVVLDGQNEASRRRDARLTGRWSYRGTTGVLRGNVRP